jgi:uncharacterized lipoprotein YddW (UPF0748 family)
MVDVAAALVRQGMNRQRRQTLGWAAATLLAGCATRAGHDDDPEFGAPPLPREFRGVWVATVAHIDWPSRRDLGTAEQRREMQTLLDRAQEIGLNAIVLQVRPSGDAIYPSELEPWSEYLTGASGRPPEVPWDPLAEWIAGCHERGLELHAWFNPFRARHPSATSPLAASHVANRDPAIVKAYGDLLWMDPGEPRAAQQFVDVVLDVVNRYDIDGVHIDDYFYPYPVAGDTPGSELPFPDEPSYRAYGEAGGDLALVDWRRDNVDRLIQRLHAGIHGAKPWVRFGISPFGLPRPDLRPPGITGFSQYDKLYAHVERWLHEGWLDYLAPQLYWPIAQAAQAFPVLLDAWRAQNRQGRHLWTGLFTSRIGAAERAYPADEVLQQVALLRQRPDTRGHIHFSMVALLQNREGIADALRNGPYASPALVPATPWLAGQPPARPRASLFDDAQDQPSLRLWAARGSALRTLALRIRRGSTWRVTLMALTGVHHVPLSADDDLVLVQGIDRVGLASAVLALRRRSSGWSFS